MDDENNQEREQGPEGLNAHSEQDRRRLLRLLGAGIVLSAADMEGLVAAMMPSAPVGAAAGGFPCTGGFHQPFCNNYTTFYWVGQDCGSYECNDFHCAGSASDDFECTTNFSCTGMGGGDNFHCSYSFDDEDCEGQFTCGWGWECFSRYNK